jgi:hypothetical protein
MAEGQLRRPIWSQLSPGAKAFRVGHMAIGVVGVTSLAYVWTCAVTRRRDRRLGVAIFALTMQGFGVVLGRGNCPLGPLQRGLGDPVPLFELVLPPRAARVAIPALAALTLVGVIALLARPPR